MFLGPRIKMCASSHPLLPLAFPSNAMTTMTFPHALPKNRLGIGHKTLVDFNEAVYPHTGGKPTPRPKRKEFSLVVVTESSRGRRILLGMKHRGFGSGFFNSFGGKLDECDASPAAGAVRELEEETNIKVPLNIMERGEVGMLNFTFDDDEDAEMAVHLFRVDVTCMTDDSDIEQTGLISSGLEPFPIDPTVIRGCDEITPEWFDDWTDIPLDRMFADDSIWLTRLLAADDRLCFDGWFHFHPGKQDVNSVQHYCLETKEDRKEPSFSLQQRLFHCLHGANSPSVKEFKECWSFASAVQRFFGKNEFDVIIDVAGGQGMLASLLLILTSARRAVVIDPAVGIGGIEFVRKTWCGFYAGKDLVYRHECLREALPDELKQCIAGGVVNTRILVVACHACQHLSDETVEIATGKGVHIAVMPCCQKDQTDGSWKAAGKQLGVGIGPLMDILLAGKVMSWDTGRSRDISYRVKMKMIDKKITPQNRLIMCKAEGRSNHVCTKRIERSHQQLTKAYFRAHSNRREADEEIVGGDQWHLCMPSAAIGLCAGVFLCSGAVFLHRRS